MGGHEYSPTGQLLISKQEYLYKTIVRAKTVWILNWIAIPAFGLNKLSVLLLYRRIFDTRVKAASPIFRTLLWFLIVICIMWTVAFFWADICKLPAHARSDVFD